MKNFDRVYIPLIFFILLLLAGCKKVDPGNTVKDIDGNVYTTLTIGAQVWMKENLKVSRYSDGTNIPADTYYQDGTDPRKTYGNLYTWSAATKGAVSSNANPSDVQGACPVNWHLPSDSEWQELSDHLGGDLIAGGKMKEAGTTNWESPNTGATNESGFTGLPGGWKYSYYLPGNGVSGYWWSSTGAGTAKAKYVSLKSYTEDFNFEQSWEMAYMSVRCIRDY